MLIACIDARIGIRKIMNYKKILLCAVLFFSRIQADENLTDQEREEIIKRVEAIIPKIENGELDVNVRDSDGCTPLYLAARHGAHSNLIEFLIKKGADPSLKEIHGNSALHAVCISDADPYIFQALLKTGADINAENNGGITPLHFATTNNRIAMVKMLIEAGADIHKRLYGQNAYIMAVLKGHDEIARLLEKAGAQKDLFYHLCMIHNYMKNRLGITVSTILALYIIVPILFRR
jgi:ankyrin repeat protein